MHASAALLHVLTAKHATSASRHGAAATASSAPQASNIRDPDTARQGFDQALRTAGDRHNLRSRAQNLRSDRPASKADADGERLQPPASKEKPDVPIDARPPAADKPAVEAVSVSNGSAPQPSVEGQATAPAADAAAQPQVGASSPAVAVEVPVLTPRTSVGQAVDPAASGAQASAQTPPARGGTITQVDPAAQAAASAAQANGALVPQINGGPVSAAPVVHAPFTPGAATGPAGDGAVQAQQTGAVASPILEQVMKDGAAAAEQTSDTGGDQGRPAGAPPASVADARPAPVPPAAGSLAVTPDPSDPPTDANVARVARGLQSALAQRGGTVSLRLEPPELGVLRIQMQVQDGQVRARFTTGADSVRTLLNHQMDHLRHALERQGMVVDRLEVQLQQPNAPSGSQQQSQQAWDDQGRSRGQFFTSDQGRQSDRQSRDDTNPSTYAQVHEEMLNLLG